MMFYALAVLPLIRSLSSRDLWVQSWYADNTLCLVALPTLKDWLNLLSNEGPNYGYFPKTTKLVSVVNSQHEAKA